MVISSSTTYTHILLRTFNNKRLSIIYISTQSIGEESLAYLEGESMRSELVYVNFSLPDHLPQLSKHESQHKYDYFGYNILRNEEDKSIVTKNGKTQVGRTFLHHPESIAKN